MLLSFTQYPSLISTTPIDKNQCKFSYRSNFLPPFHCTTQHITGLNVQPNIVRMPETKIFMVLGVAMSTSYIKISAIPFHRKLIMWYGRGRKVSQQCRATFSKNKCVNRTVGSSLRGGVCVWVGVESVLFLLLFQLHTDTQVNKVRLDSLLTCTESYMREDSE